MRKTVIFILLVSSTYATQNPTIATPLEELIIWSALFGLGAIGLLSLFLSSFRLKRITQKHQEMLKLKENIQERHQMILESMTHNIEMSTKGIRRYKEVLKQNDFKSMPEDLFKEEMNRFEKSETLLLDTTHELVDFLQIRSGNLDIINESYKLDNLLNETYGLISDHIEMSKSELLYDIDPEIATELHGDSKRIEQILRTFLIDIITGLDNSIVTMKISTIGEDESFIRFELHTKDKVMLKEEIKSLFSIYTLDESYKSKEKLDLYVATELVKQMDGSFDVESSDENGTTYIVDLPYKPIKTSPLKSPKSADKRLLILEDDAHRAQAVLKMLKQHDLSVIDCADSQSLVSHMPDFQDYDIVIVNTKLLFLTIVEKLEKVKKEKPLIVVETYNSHEKKYAEKSNGLVDESLQKPLQNEQLYTLLEKVFDKKSDITSVQVQRKDTYIPVKKAETITKENFSEFAHIHVLIAEDNMMNQKILKSVLDDSGMQIILANNGQEAIDEIEKNNNIDLVLMDTNMPVMDGYEATKRIRQKYDIKQLPIVAISASGFKNGLSKMESAGANACLCKPFKLAELYDVFSMYVEHSKNKVNTTSPELTKYQGNVEILNIEKGISYSNSVIFYKELLEEVLVNFKEINGSFAQWILKRDDKKTKEFVSHALKLADNIGAASFVKILKEMNQLFIYKEESRLSEYLPLYGKEWNKLRKEIEAYLKV